MKQITEEIKNQINSQCLKYKPLIDKYAKTRPKIGYNYFDGWYLFFYWSSETASVEFWFRRGCVELMAYRDDESEWMEIDEGRPCSCIQRFGKREKVEPVIKEEYVKEAFDWLYGG